MPTSNQNQPSVWRFWAGVMPNAHNRRWPGPSWDGLPGFQESAKLGVQAILDTERIARSIILLLCCLVKFSALSADMNSITADRACWSTWWQTYLTLEKSEACYENITCMALTAPHEADIEESLSNVTELGKFCTITCTNISTSVFFKPQVLVNSQWECFPLSLFEGCLNALRNT